MTMNDNDKQQQDQYTSETGRAMTEGFAKWLQETGTTSLAGLLRSAYLGGWYDGAKDMANTIKKELK